MLAMPLDGYDLFFVVTLGLFTYFLFGELVSDLWQGLKRRLRGDEEEPESYNAGFVLGSSSTSRRRTDQQLPPIILRRRKQVLPTETQDPRLGTRSVRTKVGRAKDEAARERRRQGPNPESGDEDSEDS